MPAELLCGRALSAAMLRRISHETALLPRPPCVAVVMVGSRPDSARYVARKRRVAESCGIRLEVHGLPESVGQAELQAELRRLSGDGAVDGVMLQLPLPSRLRARPALLCIDPGKDVDGLHPLNAGNLFLHESPGQRSFPRLEEYAAADPLRARHLVEGRYFLPCTALAVRALLCEFFSRAATDATAAAAAQRTQLPRRNLHAVILNTSMVVGVPTAALLQKEGNFIVTLCGRANDLSAVREVSRTGDILIAALGIPHVITGDFVKEGAVVVDVAINEESVSVGNETRRVVCGDVDAASVMERAAALTPVPGGVGPLTVAYLMQNTLKAYYLARKRKSSIPANFVSMYAKPAEEGGELRAGDDEEAVEPAEFYGGGSESSFGVV